MVMKKKKGVTKYTLRHYDAYDHYWFDIPGTVGVSYEEAIKKWAERTKMGTQFTKYSDGAYYEIFPADTRMIFDEPLPGR